MSVVSNPDIGRSLRPLRSFTCVIVVVVVFFPASFTKWGSPGHTGWCRGMISGARDQARAPLKTTHDPHCFVSHFACYLQLLLFATPIAQLNTVCSFCHVHRAAQYCLLFIATPIAQLNPVFSLILAARQCARSPIFCSR